MAFFLLTLNALNIISFINNFFTAKEPPTLTSLCDKEIFEGETCEFKTTVTGIPKPEIEWFLDNKRVDQKLVKVDGSVNSINLKKMTPSRVRITVRAKNVAGECEKHSYLTVKG